MLRRVHACPCQEAPPAPSTGRARKGLQGEAPQAENVPGKPGNLQGAPPPATTLLQEDTSARLLSMRPAPPPSSRLCRDGSSMT